MLQDAATGNYIGPGCYKMPPQVTIGPGCYNMPPNVTILDQDVTIYAATGNYYTRMLQYMPSQVTIGPGLMANAVLVSPLNVAIIIAL